MSDRRGSRGGAAGRAQDAVILAVSAFVVLAGAAVAQRFPSPPAQASAHTSAALPPPLPSGAPPRSLDDLPADDERDTGCHFSDRGFGDYLGWRKLAFREGAPIAKALVPPGRAVGPDGGFRLLVHFHGAEPVRKALAPEGFDLVIAGVDAGTGSRAYERAFPPGAFDELVTSIEREVAAVSDNPDAHARTIILSSWSAGYGALGPILARPHPRLEALILLDSLYAGYLPGTRDLDPSTLLPFLDAARAALAGGPAFFLGHTAIGTPGYASTGEVASYFLADLGLRATQIDADPAEIRPLRRMAAQGKLTIRGYDGADRDAHCAQLHLLPAILRDTVLPARIQPSTTSSP
ncbi:MAG: hypothetical protein U0359_23960 [Byssovorax sp.]